MSLLSVLDRVADHIPQEFIAPIPQANIVNIFTFQDDIPYTFQLDNPEPGWWNVQPRSKTDAVLGTRISARNKFEYLGQLPRFYVIAVVQVNETTWLCTPFNISDTEQRGWKNAEPKHVFLVSGTIEPFDVLITRKLDQILLYETVNTRVETPSRSYTTDMVGTRKDFDHAFAILTTIREQERQRQLEIERQILEQERQQKEQQRKQELDQLRNNAQAYAEHQLNLAGAEMTNFLQKSNGFEISWQYDGAEFTVNTFDNLQVRSAGICLAGNDSRESLATVVHTMQRARVANRFDLDESMWV